MIEFTMSKLAFNSRLTLLILFVGPCASLAVSPWTNYDPINLVKLVFVTTCAFAAFGLLVSTNLKATYQENRIMFNVAIGFVLWMCVCFFVSGSPLNQQFWGSFGRNTGFLTYFS